MGSISRRALYVAVFPPVIAAAFFATAAMPAQSPVAFEVASVKAIPDSEGWPPRAGYWVAPRREDPMRFRALTVLSQVIEWAYGMRDFQIVGGPAWLTQGRFEIHANAEQPSTEVQMRQMLQVLLADRFKLMLHRQTRDVPVYALVVGKNGPKLMPTQDAAVFEGMGNFEVGNGVLLARGGTMPGFCHILTDNLDRPVIDKTNLTGRYDFKLTFDPPPAGQPDWAPFGPAVFRAIQDLGLKLAAQTDRVQMLVIDSVERPSEN